MIGSVYYFTTKSIKIKAYDPKVGAEFFKGSRQRKYAKLTVRRNMPFLGRVFSTWVRVYPGWCIKMYSTREYTGRSWGPFCTTHFALLQKLDIMKYRVQSVKVWKNRNYK